jgi:type IV secretion system protein TrbI
MDPLPPTAFDPQPTDGHPTVVADPHASKIAADDPRLRLAQLGGRALRKGPAIAVAAGLLTALTGAVGLALQPAVPSHASQADLESTPSAQTPVIPEALRHPSPPPSSMVPAERPAPGASAHAGSEFAHAPPAAPDRQREIRAEEDAKALAASVLFEPHGVAAATAAPAVGFPPSGPGAPLSAPSAAPDDDPNRQGRKNQFLDSLGSSDSLESTLRHPSSPTEIQAGTIIPAVLLTAINSDIPGPVIAQVRESVYDTVSGNTLLVPQGARLLANYDSMVSWGQQRILVCWRRLLFPNGDSIDLRCAPAADLKGAAGLTDQVDEHWLRLIAGAGISSLLAATAQGAAGNQSGFAPTVPQMWASNAAQSVNASGQQVVRRDLQVQPTITVRPGFSVNVLVNKDFPLPPYPDPPAAHSVAP